MAGLRALTLGLTAFFISTASIAAQEYRSWDGNRDGVITRGEWRGTTQEFRDLDWNRDGVLSGNELNERDWARSSQYGAGRTFANLDRNSDGRLTRNEWHGNRATFARADRNGDNQISRSEFINLDVGSVDNDLTGFDALDDDGSGRIERDEWNGTRAAFNRLDLNGDGVLSRRELVSNDAVIARTDDFDVMDDNNNGVVSRGEWRDGAATFNHYDVNRDDVISRREYAVAGKGSVIEEEFTVDARQEWTDTDVYVNAGDVVTFRAEGTIQMITGGDDRATPAGSLTGRRATNSPRPDQRAGALLIRIGNGAVEAVGANGTFVARDSGRVYLGVNDDHFPDNSGNFRVWLSVSPR